MRFGGTKIQALATKVIDLPRPEGQDGIALRVRAARPEEGNRSLKLFPDTEPPKAFVYKNRGDTLPMRDPKTDKAILDQDWSDPDFLARVQDIRGNRTALMIVDALDQDGNISWEQDKPDEADLPALRVWYASCRKQMDEAGINSGDMQLILEATQELSNLDDDVTERAAEAFSLRVGPKKEG